MTYKKGQWLECIKDISDYIKGKNYRIAEVYKNDNVKIFNDSGGTHLFSGKEVEKYFKPDTRGMQRAWKNY